MDDRELLEALRTRPEDGLWLLTQQIVSRHAKQIRQHDYLFRFRHGFIPFPPTDSLSTDIQLFSQGILTHAGFLPQTL